MEHQFFRQIIVDFHQQLNPGAPNDEMYLRQADHEHMTPQLLSICTNLSLRSFEY